MQCFPREFAGLSPMNPLLMSQCHRFNLLHAWCLLFPKSCYVTVWLQISADHQGLLTYFSSGPQLTSARRLFSLGSNDWNFKSSSGKQKTHKHAHHTDDKRLKWRNVMVKDRCEKCDLGLMSTSAKSVTLNPTSCLILWLPAICFTCRNPNVLKIIVAAF